MPFSKDLENLIANANDGSTNGQKFGSPLFHEAFAALIFWAAESASLIQWVLDGVPHSSSAATAAPASGARSYTAGLQLGDANNNLNPWKSAQSVVITLTGSATGALINGLPSPQTIALVDGAASVVLSGTSTGTIIATPSAPTTGAAVGALTVTLS